MKNILFVISGPSGVGKGTMVARLASREDLIFSVSCTTRAPREGELDGVHYFFMSEEEFLTRAKAGEFLEYDNHFGNYYGTLRSFIEEKLEEGSVILDLDVVGALNLKKAYPEAVLVMLLPPDKEALKQRLIHRHSETPHQIEDRLARVDYELSLKDKFDYTVVNDVVEEAETKLYEIYRKEKNRT